MPPKGTRYERESSLEHYPELDEFLAKLTKYHEKRGTFFDSEPKVGARHLDLLKLYERIVGEGGYDSVSDTKARPLMWRKFAEEFIGKGPHIAAQAFQVKSAYYKNLAAYEITEHWKEDPPPKEILEDLTAKGGNIRGRTLDSYERRNEAVNGDGSDDETGNDNEDTVLTGRSTRGLRQAPPQRVLFQPDINSSRQSRSGVVQNVSPSPAMNSINTLSQPVINSLNTSLASYEPRPQYPLTLKPVTTPSNNPEYYRQKRKQIEELTAPAFAKRFKGIMLPGTGFIGPNIYVRAQLALQSGIPDEEKYALHHLVKISHERGDKYRFDQFPGLAEALVNKVLQVSGLFYNVEWIVDYADSNTSDADDLLDGLRGTPSILNKLQSKVALDMTDSVQSQQYFEQLNRITEAGLVIRNMVMLDENAHYVSRMPLMRDYTTVVLTLNHPSLVELQHYALETIEQTCVYYSIDSQNILYRALLHQIQSDDRGKIITALRATARLGMKFSENKRLDDVPASILEDICEWLLVDDEELRSAALDFLYQYTSTADNVTTLIGTVNTPVLVDQLSKLLLFDARKISPSSRRHQPEEEEEAPVTKVPRLSRSLIEALLRYDEPERSSRWLRMCFQDDPTTEMTQIDLWKSYQGTFLTFAATHPHLIAGEFIKNVSNTFNGASAQVAGQNKYVIRGIKPRKIPVDSDGRQLIQCRWTIGRDAMSDPAGSIFAGSDGEECAQWFRGKDALLSYILTRYLQIPDKSAEALEIEAAKRQPTDANAFPFWRFDFAAGPVDKERRCHWSTCRYVVDLDSVSAQGPLSWKLFARHIDTHLPDHGTRSPPSKEKHSDKSHLEASGPHWLNTSVDETMKDPCGLPLGAVLCLRNIARALGRLPNEGEVVEQAIQAVPGKEEDSSDNETMDPALGGEGQGESSPARVDPRKSRRAVLLRKVFGNIRQRLFFTLGHNHVLRDYVGDVLRSLAKSGAF